MGPKRKADPCGMKGKKRAFFAFLLVRICFSTETLEGLLCFAEEAGHGFANLCGGFDYGDAGFGHGLHLLGCGAFAA